MALDKGVALIPSNQHLNQYTGLPLTEEQVQNTVALVTQRELVRNGVRCEIFHVPGAGSSSVDELLKAIEDCNARGPWDVVVAQHSDACYDAAITGVLGIVYNQERVAWGQWICGPLSQKLGLPYRGVWNTKDYKSFAVITRTLAPAIIIEVGEHATESEAAWIVENVPRIGLATAHAVLEAHGVPIIPDEPVSMSKLFQGYPDNSGYHWQEPTTRKMADTILYRHLVRDHGWS